ncbi:helicase HerA domain-containing protein [Tessaracoccus lacteus]|uniref:DUF87 domain-containing protein n=1 Tax=Tessaracoccus lacteus TaxID=3041766 RepID=A0ABY8PZ15_9ACTN|nr:DUF87 domain-containing protein [Tessaracoccus sp. T21]WGT47606.1 DUF87 domain-containing protein [Tessaracoccus sp. T21]
MTTLLIGTAAVKRQPVALSLPGLLHHTLIVGQSGSGKSFFVARLIEEILLRTGARVVALDPNGDLRSLDRVQVAGLTTQRAEASAAATVAQLPDFDNPADFEAAWGSQRMIFLSAEREPPLDGPQRIERRRLFVDWAKIGDIQDSLLELNSHERPAQFLGVRACRGLVKWANDERSGLKLPYSLRGLADAAALFGEQNVNMRVYEYAKNLTKADWDNVKARFLDLAARHLAWLPDEERSTAYRAMTLTDILDAPFSTKPILADWNCLIIGLDAAQQADALLAASVALNQLWSNAKRQTRLTANDDPRVPTFIVIDEAHNFVPATTTDPLRRRVSEQVLQIASEGRKFGLYLILATQRPTKLHPELVPECENSCVLRVQSDRELRFASETLGIQHARVEPASRFTTGQGLLSGRWVGGELVEVLAAPARTSVGGGGLSDTWMGGARPIMWARTLAVNPVDEEAPLLDASPKSDVAAEAARLVVEQIRSSSEPVPLAALAHQIRSTLGVGEPDWDGSASFKDYLLRLEIPNLQIDPKGPSYALLTDMATATEQSESGIIDRLHREIDLPRLTSEEYAAIFNAISDELAVNPFGLTQTSKAIRDALQTTATPVNRASINYVLKGIGIGGHDFSPDRSQDPNVLAEAFLRGVVKTANIAQERVDQLSLLRSHIAGALEPQVLIDDEIQEEYQSDPSAGSVDILARVIELKRARRYPEAREVVQTALAETSWTTQEDISLAGELTRQGAFISRRLKDRDGEITLLRSYLVAPNRHPNDEEWVRARLNMLVGM